MKTDTEKKNSPATTSGAYDAMAPLWKICRDVSGGTQKMREAGTEYLPKNAGEKEESYQKRLKRTVLFNAYRKTREGMTGMVFRKEPSLSDGVEENIKEHLKNVDLAGTDLNSFALRTFDEALNTGLFHVVVDYPTTGGVRNREEEIRANIRPYWIGVRPENLVSWRSEIINGQVVLLQAVIREETVAPDGEFGEQCVVRYRVWTPMIWRLLEVQNEDGKEKIVQVQSGAHSLGLVPLVTLNFNPDGFMSATPPLLNLAEQNIAHWQATADHKNLLHIVSIAALVLKGRTKDQMEKDIIWSMESTIDIPKDGDAFFLEHEGKALNATSQELKDTEERMARMGLSMIAEGDVDIKATKLRFDKVESDSLLARFAKELDRGINQCLEIHAKWLKLESGGSYATNKDFQAQALSADEVNRLSEMVSSGKLSLETMWELLVTGEWLPENFDHEEEQRRIDREGDGSLGDLEDGGGAAEEEEELEPEGD